VKEHDLIVGYDGRNVRSIDDLHRLLTEREIGRPATPVVVRRAERLERRVTPVERGESRRVGRAGVGRIYSCSRNAATNSRGRRIWSPR
jgi:hypothetical protein